MGRRRVQIVRDPNPIGMSLAQGLLQGGQSFLEAFNQAKQRALQEKWRAKADSRDDRQLALAESNAKEMGKYREDTLGLKRDSMGAAMRAAEAKAEAAQEKARRDRLMGLARPLAGVDPGLAFEISNAPDEYSLKLLMEKATERANAARGDQAGIVAGAKARATKPVELQYAPKIAGAQESARGNVRMGITAERNQREAEGAALDKGQQPPPVLPSVRGHQPIRPPQPRVMSMLPPTEIDRRNTEQDTESLLKNVETALMKRQPIKKAAALSAAEAWIVRGPQRETFEQADERKRQDMIMDKLAERGLLAEGMLIP